MADDTVEELGMMQNGKVIGRSPFAVSQAGGILPMYVTGIRKKGSEEHFLEEQFFLECKENKKILNRFEEFIGRFNASGESEKRRFIAYSWITFIFGCIMLYIFCTDYSILILFYCLWISGFAVLFSFYLFSWISKHDEGTPAMRDVAAAVRLGSEGFFQVQYSTIFRISIIFSLLIAFVFFIKGFLSFLSTPATRVSAAKSWSTEVPFYSLAIVTSVCFLMGAFCSAFTGYIGMWVSVRTNVRVASASRRCYNDALRLCFRGGAFCSIINVALAVGGIALMLTVLKFIYSNTVPFTDLPLMLVGYGFGASLVAMFAQLGGGIYTKGADVGADLVGKFEADIPEDDSRNPATIADLVGDNVGDCAGQCADLFESIAAEIISAMILGASLARSLDLEPQLAAGFVLFPLGVHCMDLGISSLGILFVKTKKGMPDADSASGAPEDPLKIMIRAYVIICVVGCIGFTLLCRFFLYLPKFPHAWKYFSACGAIGMVCAFLFLIFTQYYTDYEYPKVRQIAEASTTGPGTNVIAGLSVGLESTALPCICISMAIISSYYLGVLACADSSFKHSTGGLFGTATATMGMLSTAVFVLSMSSFGPIADNAGGIVEMTQQPEHVRAITDRLDAVGNVTKANTKGFSVGSAALACFLLFWAFLDEVSVYAKVRFDVIDLAIPEVFVGGLIGAMIVFLFSSWAMEAVGRAAQEVVKEVRRQYMEYPGIMDYSVKPDYHACVTIVSRGALKHMIKPGLLAAAAPVVVGLIFRVIGHFQKRPLLGAQVLGSFLIFSTTSGILMALFLNNAGGAWDNAKKYIETGALGGKGSETHKAAVVGDTVGDPAKDTAGPSVHVLIKLVSTVTMVLTPVFVSSVVTE